MLNLMLDRTIVSTTSTAPRVPVWLKLAYTAFMAVLVPVYLRNYGPTNFLYFCDVALIITLVGIWIESPLLVSMCAVGKRARMVAKVLRGAQNPAIYRLNSQPNLNSQSI
jgi:hypothetical protein